MKQMENKNNLLMFSGLLVIVFGLASTVVAFLFSQSAIDLAVSTVDISQTDIETVKTITFVSIISLSVVGLIIDLVAGVLAMKQTKPMACFVMGVLLLLLSAVSLVSSITTQNKNAIIIGLNIATVIVLMIYVVGSLQLRNRQ